jgi:hypothetical protein
MKVPTKIHRAFLRFVEMERQLLDAGTNERSMTHRFAIQIERLFRGYAVDCEYNRDGRDPKRLESFRRTVRSDDTGGVTVYPDVIVHRRGTPDNFVVIEAKTSASQEPCLRPARCHCDRCKLRAYKSDLRYAHAFFVLFPVGRQLATFTPANLQDYIEEIQ